MNTEQKAKAYDEALEIARKELLACGSTDCDAARQIFRIFPELKEGEDEKVRKELIDAINGLWDNDALPMPLSVKRKDAWLAWLKKQGEPTDINPSEFDLRLNRLLKQFETLPKEELASSLSFYLNVIQNDGAYKPDGKQGEQKPADKVEPKFKVGDWVVDEEDNYVYQVIRVISNVSNGLFSYDLTDSGYFYSTKTNCHLWTIKDAKDGDMIYVSTEEKGIQAIFHEYKNRTIFFHCYLCIDFVQGGYMPIGSVELVYPLQKVHYRRFFEKMHEAGCEWDAEKKELKKISQRMVSAEAKEALYDKPAWSEEDENKTNTIISVYHPSPNIVDWLKSLKQRIGWKPSDEQMKALHDLNLTGNISYAGQGQILIELYNDLKKLTE